MKVIMLTASYWPDPGGGAERQCRKLTHALAAMGLACTVVTARTARGRPARDRDGAVEILRLGALAPLERAARRCGDAFERFLWERLRLDARRWKPAVAAVRFWMQFVPNHLARRSFIAALRRLARQGGLDADVLHVHESSWLAGVAVELGRRTGVPVLAKEASFPVLGVIGYDTPGRRRWDRLRREACFQAQTPAGADALAAAGLPRSRIHVVPNGVERAVTTADVRANTGVLYIGNFSQGAHWKAFDVLIDAWALVHREAPDARLTLAGGGDTSGWHDYARRLGCDAALRFVGATDRPEALYAQAAFLVLPSRVEGMSNVLLEAQAAGLPAVVSGIPGNRAVVDDGANGLVVPVNDAPALAAAILRLLREPDLRARLGEGARRRVESEFAIDRVAARLAGLYASLKGAPPCAF